MQIGLAMAQYVQDYDHTLPHAWFGRDAGPSNAKTNYKWMDALQPYTPLQPRFFECPTDTRQKPYSIRDGTNYGSYAINNAYSATGDKLTPPVAQKSARIAHPSMVILVTDGNGSFQSTWPDIKSTPPLSAIKPRQLGSFFERHISGTSINVLFCDGHVYSSSFEKFRDTSKSPRIYNALTIEDD